MPLCTILSRVMSHTYGVGTLVRSCNVCCQSCEHSFKYWRYMKISGRSYQREALAYVPVMSCADQNMAWNDLVGCWTECLTVCCCDSVSQV